MKEVLLEVIFASYLPQLVVMAALLAVLHFGYLVSVDCGVKFFFVFLSMFVAFQFTSALWLHMFLSIILSVFFLSPTSTLCLLASLPLLVDCIISSLSWGKNVQVANCLISCRSMTL